MGVGVGVCPLDTGLDESSTHVSIHGYTHACAHAHTYVYTDALFLAAEDVSDDDGTAEKATSAQLLKLAVQVVRPNASHNY